MSVGLTGKAHAFFSWGGDTLEKIADFPDTEEFKLNGCNDVFYVIIERRNIYDNCNNHRYLLNIIDMQNLEQCYVLLYARFF